MKKERRRNSRVEVRIPVEMSSRESGARFKVNTTDIGEGGLAISLPRRSKPHGRWALSFTLPGSTSALEVDAEFAWEGTGTQVGLRFQEQKPEFARQLREWLGRNSPDAEKDDPPARCQLTDLSLGGCYLDIASPFPVSTRVTLSMRAAGVELRARALLEKFLNLLTEHRDVQPELMVEPEGLEAESANTLSDRAIGEVEDALLGLFRNQAALPTDSFLAELRKQRGVAAGVSV